MYLSEYELNPVNAMDQLMSNTNNGKRKGSITKYN
jgi:hypothetical protein